MKRAARAGVRCGVCGHPSSVIRHPSSVIGHPSSVIVIGHRSSPHTYPGQNI
ncbi:MAG: hypothetical protein ACK475_10145 [Bacteroidota bacterium]